MDAEDGREREVSQELQRRSGMKAQGVLVPLEVFQRELEQRTITTTKPTDHAGGNLVATDHLGGQYIDRLRAALITRRLGARVLSGLQGNVDIPRLDSSATGHWVAEDSAITVSDADFGKTKLSPKHCGCITEYSRNMLQQSSPDIENLLRDDFAKLLAEAIDRVAIQGGGSNEPTGILGTTGIGSVTTSGTPSWANILQLIEEVEVDDAMGSAFATCPGVVRMLRSAPKELDGSSVAVSADYIMEGPRTLAGYPCAVSNVVPANLGAGNDESALIFGNWSDLLIGYWSAFDILVNPFESTAYAKGNVQIRGMMTVDIAVRHPESFAAAIDITTALGG